MRFEVNPYDSELQKEYLRSIEVGDSVWINLWIYSEGKYHATISF